MLYNNICGLNPIRYKSHAASASSGVNTPSVEEAVRVEERRCLEDALVAKVVKKLIELAPDLVKRALKESGVTSEMEKLRLG